MKFAGMQPKDNKVVLRNIVRSHYDHRNKRDPCISHRDKSSRRVIEFFDVSRLIEDSLQIATCREKSLLHNVSSCQCVRNFICRDRSDNRTAWRLAARFALMKQVRKCALDRTQIRNTEPDFRESRPRNSSDAAAVCTILKLKQGRKFLKAEAQGLAAFDKTDAVDMGRRVAAISARSAAGLGHQAPPFVIAHRFNPDACRCSDSPDCHPDFLHNTPLDSVPKYGHYSSSASISTSRRAE